MDQKKERVLVHYGEHIDMAFRKLVETQVTRMLTDIDGWRRNRPNCFGYVRARSLFGLCLGSYALTPTSLWCASLTFL